MAILYSGIEDSSSDIKKRQSEGKWQTSLSPVSSLALRYGYKLCTTWTLCFDGTTCTLFLLQSGSWPKRFDILYNMKAAIAALIPPNLTANQS